MQLYALDAHIPLSASNAEKGKDYVCPECLSPVRVRGGPSRQIHFYHPSLTQQCSRHEKSQQHIQLQLKLLDLIGISNAQIECRFPSIQRIADVAWHAKKLVFEIQCSPISLEEVQSRVQDYASAGYQVIWILHEKQFNQKNLSAAESFLRTIPCYFTNMNEAGVGIVYDQFEVIKDCRRLFKGPPLTLYLNKFSHLPSIAPLETVLPQAVLSRFVQWKCYAEGDLLYRLLKEGNLSHAVKKMLSIEKRICDGNPSLQESLPLKNLIASSYRFVINHLLKKLSVPR